MVTKKKIGKIQLIIGIIVLIIGIIGLIYSGDRFAEELVRNISFDFGGTIMASFIMSVLSTSIILIILSLMFITQGLLNKSENQNGN